MSNIWSRLINLGGLITGTLPVANGGTGVTTSTGTTNTVLSNGPTLVAPVLGTPASGNLSNCTNYPAATSSTAGTITGEESGTFTGTLTGCTTSPTATCGFARAGKIVTITVPALTATSNTTACTITTNLPSTCYPARTSSFLSNVVNAGTDVTGVCNMGTGGTITLTASVAGATFTNSGAKGLDFGITFSYTTS